MRRAVGALAALGTMLTLATLPARAGRDCAWTARIPPTAVNALYPDQYANYWVATLPAVPGAHLEIRGRFPHARYVSFVTYAATLQSADGLNDASIEPDAGSTNPFRAGESRTVDDEHRWYTVHVRYGAPPPQRAPNTVYTSNADGSKAGAYFNVIYRVYRPDRAHDPNGDMSGDISGGVGLPTITYLVDAGPETAGYSLPGCDYQDVPATSLNSMIANGGGQNSGGTVQHPGYNPPRWHKFQNFLRSLSQGATENGYWGATFSNALRPAADALPPGGFADNPDNNYIFALLSHGYGQIAVFKAKLPATPDTWADAASMPGGVQLRYWSMCSNDGPTQRYFACAIDDQVRPYLDGDGYYTIVVSTPADRPAGIETAAGRASCKCVWLPWGPGGSVVLIMRNMLPDPSFANSIQKAHYDTEPTDMQAYYPGYVPNIAGPAACYMTKAAFESGQRCPTQS